MTLPSLQQLADLLLTDTRAIRPNNIDCPQTACKGCTLQHAFSANRCFFWDETVRASTIREDTLSYLKLHHPETFL